MPRGMHAITNPQICKAGHSSPLLSPPLNLSVLVFVFVILSRGMSNDITENITSLHENKVSQSVFFSATLTQNVFSITSGVMTSVLKHQQELQSYLLMAWFCINVLQDKVDLFSWVFISSREKIYLCSYISDLLLPFPLQWPTNTWRTVPCSVCLIHHQGPTPQSTTTWWPVPASGAPTVTCWCRAVRRRQQRLRQLQPLTYQTTSAPWTVRERHFAVSSFDRNKTSNVLV